MPKSAVPQNNNASSVFFQQHVPAFCTLCETKSFTKTAQLLNVNQSTVSRMISELESKLGIALIEHNVRPIRTTTAGQSLYRLLASQRDALAAGVGELRDNHAFLSPLRLGFVESVARAMSWSVVNDLQGGHSEVTVLTGISSYLLRLLDDEAVDVIICPDPFAHRNDLQRRFIFREPSIVILPKKSGLPKNLTWERLRYSQLPMINYHSANSGGKLEQKFFDKLGLRFPHTVEVDINALLLDYVARGMGWSLTRPTSLVQHPDLAKYIDVRPMPEPIASRELYVISRKNLHNDLAKQVASSCVRCFREEMVPQILRWAPWSGPYLYTAGPHPHDRLSVFAESEGAVSEVFVL